MTEWEWLVHAVNGRSVVGMPGIRDPEHPCEMFDGKGYDGRGGCDSDGHYMCLECSHLSAEGRAE